MAEYGQLRVETRKAAGKGATRELKRRGRFPAVIYGQGQDNVSIAIEPHAFGVATDPTRGVNTFFNLTIVDGDKTVGVVPCVIADIQRDALRGDTVHVDFMRVDPEREVVRPVPVRTIGRAAGVVKGGRIRTTRRNVQVAAKPADIPFEIVIDVTPLDNGQSIRMRDVVLTNARISEPADAVLAICELARKVEDEAAPGAAPAAAGGAKPAAAAAKPAAKPADKKK